MNLCSLSFKLIFKRTIYFSLWLILKGIIGHLLHSFVGFFICFFTGTPPTHLFISDLSDEEWSLWFCLIMIYLLCPLESNSYLVTHLFWINRLWLAEPVTRCCCSIIHRLTERSLSDASFLLARNGHIDRLTFLHHFCFRISLHKYASNDQSFPSRINNQFLTVSYESFSLCTFIKI